MRPAKCLGSEESPAPESDRVAGRGRRGGARAVEKPETEGWSG